LHVEFKEIDLEKQDEATANFIKAKIEELRLARESYDHSSSEDEESDGYRDYSTTSLQDELWQSEESQISIEQSSDCDLDEFNQHMIDS
jgi:hypothetical protein